jgi:hypothetical protein
MYAIGGSSPTSGNAVGTQQWIEPTGAAADIPGANATAGVAGLLDVTIPNYAGTTFQKVGLWRSGYMDGATAAADSLTNAVMVAWRNTAAITSITVIPVAGNLVAGTTAYLYLS